jgi:hypothetical protein
MKKWKELLSPFIDAEMEAQREFVSGHSWAARCAGIETQARKCMFVFLQPPVDNYSSKAMICLIPLNSSRILHRARRKK